MAAPNTVFARFSQAWPFWHWLAVIGLALNLAACGFHLKGTGPNAIAGFKSIQLVETQGVQAEILRALRLQLQASDVKVVEAIGQAEIVLRFAPTQTQISDTSISGQGDASSQLIKVTQPIRVENVATEAPLLDSQVSAYRDRRIDNAAALASNRELRAIQQEMATDIAAQIIDRINRARAEPAK